MNKRRAKSQITITTRISEGNGNARAFVSTVENAGRSRGDDGAGLAGVVLLATPVILRKPHVKNEIFGYFFQAGLYHHHMGKLNWNQAVQNALYG